MNNKDNVIVLFLNSEKKGVKKKKKEKRCSSCGYYYSDFKEIGFLGCPDCYKTFFPEIIKYIKKIHKNIKYKGQIPKKFKNEDKKTGYV